MHRLHLFRDVIKSVISVSDAPIALAFSPKLAPVWSVLISHESEFVFGIKWNPNIGPESHLLCSISMEEFREVADNQSILN